MNDLSVFGKLPNDLKNKIFAYLPVGPPPPYIRCINFDLTIKYTLAETIILWNQCMKPRSQRQYFLLISLFSKTQTLLFTRIKFQDRINIMKLSNIISQNIILVEIPTTLVHNYVHRNVPQNSAEQSGILTRYGYFIQKYKYQNL